MSEVNLAVVAVAFAVYTMAIVAVGLYSARYARRSDEDYFLAGRSLGGWVAALSASASSESGWVTLGLVGIGYASGVQAYWVIPGCLIGYLFNWFVIAGRMNDQARRFGAVTLPDYFAFRFNERVPLIRTLAVAVILGGVVQLAVQVPVLRRYGFRYRPLLRLKDPRFRKVLALFLPGLAGLAVVQVNVGLDYVLGLIISQRAPADLYYANRLVQLPLGLFGVAIATATLPTLSKLRATGSRRRSHTRCGRRWRSRCRPRWG